MPNNPGLLQSGTWANIRWRKAVAVLVSLKRRIVARRGAVDHARRSQCDIGMCLADAPARRGSPPEVSALLGLQGQHGISWCALFPAPAEFWLSHNSERSKSSSDPLR